MHGRIVDVCHSCDTTQNGLISLLITAAERGLARGRPGPFYIGNYAVGMGPGVIVQAGLLRCPAT